MGVVGATRTLEDMLAAFEEEYAEAGRQIEALVEEARVARIAEIEHRPDAGADARAESTRIQRKITDLYRKKDRLHSEITLRREMVAANVARQAAGERDSVIAEARTAFRSQRDRIRGLLEQIESAWPGYVIAAEAYGAVIPSDAPEERDVWRVLRSVGQELSDGGYRPDLGKLGNHARGDASLQRS